MPTEDEGVLDQVHRVSARVAAPRPLDEARDEGPLRRGRDEEVGDGGEKAVLWRRAPSDRRVARPVHELVMVLVVSWNPREDREAIKERYPRRHERVHAAAGERGRMIVIVGDDAGAVSKVHRNRQQPAGEPRLCVLGSGCCGHEHERPYDCSYVGAASKVHDVFSLSGRVVSSPGRGESIRIPLRFQHAQTRDEDRTETAEASAIPGDRQCRPRSDRSGSRARGRRRSDDDANRRGRGREHRDALSIFLSP